MRRHSGKRDLTEGAIVTALTKAGVDIDYAERKPYDLICGRGQQCFLLEVKTGKKPLTPSQIEFRRTWRGHYAVVRTPTEALRAVGLIA